MTAHAPANAPADAKAPATAPLAFRQRALVPILLALLVLGGGFFLRAHRLENKSIWWDEGYTGWLARQPLADIALTAAHDVHPPLFYGLLGGWRILSGDGEFELRYFSALIGLLAIAAVYRLGAATGGRRVALLAALLVAGSRFHITWSQEIRMYVLASLWAALALWATVRFWKRPSLRYALPYALFMAAGLYTLYLFVLVFVVANLAALHWLWTRPDRRRSFLIWAALQTATLLLYLPWLGFALGRIRTASTASPLNPLDFLKIYWTMLTIGIPLAVEQYLYLTVPVLLVALLAVIYLGRQLRGRPDSRNAYLLLLLGALFPAAAVYLLSLPRDFLFYAPQIDPRYLIICIPAYAVLLAWGLSALVRRWPRLLAPWPALGVILVAASVLPGYYAGRLAHDDYQSLVAAIDAHRRPEDAVLLLTDRDWPMFAFHTMGEWIGIPDSWEIRAEMANDFLQPIWQDHEGVWLVSTPYSAQNDPDGVFAGWLAARAEAVRSYDFGDKQLAFYARDEGRAALADRVASSAGAQPLAISSPGGLELFAYHAPLPAYESGDAIVLALFWRGHGRETVTAGLMGADGQLWQEKTETVTASGEPLRQQLNLVAPALAPGGEYAFFVRFSSGQTISFGQIHLHARQRAVMTAGDVQIEQLADYRFANGVRLLGYTLGAKAVRPGDLVSLTLYWQTDEQLEERYKVFVHIQGTVFNSDGGLLWGQQDNEPVNGSRPLPLWQPGEVIVDPYSIALSEQAPPGEYGLMVGLYHPVTGERLLVAGEGVEAADHLRLATITVTP